MHYYKMEGKCENETMNLKKQNKCIVFTWPGYRADQMAHPIHFPPFEMEQS